MATRKSKKTIEQSVPEQGAQTSVTAESGDAIATVEVVEPVTDHSQGLAILDVVVGYRAFVLELAAFAMEEQQVPVRRDALEVSDPGFDVADGVVVINGHGDARLFEL